MMNYLSWLPDALLLRVRTWQARRAAWQALLDERTNPYGLDFGADEASCLVPKPGGKGPVVGAAALALPKLDNSQV